MEKIIVTSSKEAETKINPLLKEGWKVKSVTAENVSCSSAVGGQTHYKVEHSIVGDIIFVIENDKL